MGQTGIPLTFPKAHPHYLPAFPTLLHSSRAAHYTHPHTCGALFVTAFAPQTSTRCPPHAFPYFCVSTRRYAHMNKVDRNGADGTGTPTLSSTTLFLIPHYALTATFAACALTRYLRPRIRTPLAESAGTARRQRRRSLIVHAPAAVPYTGLRLRCYRAKILHR